MRLSNAQQCVFAVLILFQCLLLPPVQAATSAEETLLDDLSQRLAFHEGVKGSFKQFKYLSFMSKPLESQGVFSLHEHSGLYWHVQDPVDSVMTVRGSTVLLDGVKVNDSGVGQLMAAIMSGLLNGDLKGLSADFILSGELDDDGWELLLSPKNPLLRTVLSQVVVHGNTVLQSIEVQEKSKNRTLVEFNDVRENNLREEGSSELLNSSATAP